MEITGSILCFTLRCAIRAGSKTDKSIIEIHQQHTYIITCTGISDIKDYLNDGAAIFAVRSGKVTQIKFH
jgi:hypothetical protein